MFSLEIYLKVRSIFFVLYGNLLSLEEGCKVLTCFFQATEMNGNVQSYVSLIRCKKVTHASTPWIKELTNSQRALINLNSTLNI